LAEKGKRSEKAGRKDPLRFEGARPRQGVSGNDRKGWLRLRGIIAIIAVFVLIAVIWLFAVDYLVKRAIEVVGTESVGARVELASADLTLSPLGVTLKGLKVTNPDEPMTNAFEAAVIRATIEPSPLFMRKIIIDDLKVKGLRFATARKKSGAVKYTQRAAIKKKAETLKKNFEMPSFEKPDIKAILASEDLKTRDLIESLKSDIEKARGGWAGQIKGLPGKEKIEDYKRRFKALEKSTKGSGFMGLLSNGAELLSLQKDLKKDLKSIKKANKGLKQTINSYKGGINGIGKAVNGDVRRLTDKYLMPGGMLRNMTLMIFGERVAAVAEKGTYWYKRLEPFIERAGKRDGEVEVVENLRGSGAWVRFREKNPLPDFLIRKAVVEVETGRGLISGVIKDITPDQKILGRPTTFVFKSNALKGVRRLTLRGTLNHISAEKARDELAVKVEGFSIKDGDIDISALPLRVENAVIDLDLQAGLKAEPEGRSLGSKFNMAFSKVRLIKERSAGNQMQDVIADALTGIGSFRLRGSMAGVIKDGALSGEELKISGDLDKAMEKAVASLFTKQALGLKRELRRGIMKELGGDMKGLDGELGGLEGLSKELTNRLDLGKLKAGKGGGLPKIKF